MLLVLEPSDGDKAVSLYAYNLAGEDDFAAPVSNPHPGTDMDSLNRRLSDDKYFVLTGIKFNPGMESVADS